MRKKFLRRTWSRYPKLGKRKKKKKAWRKPKGRDNKMREKRKGYPATVNVGYKKNKKLRRTIGNKPLKVIQNIKELDMIKKDEMVIIGRIGKKKKIEIAKKAKEKGIKIHNLNIEKFLKENTKKEKAKDKELKTSEIKKDNKKKEDKKIIKNKNSEDKK